MKTCQDIMIISPACCLADDSVYAIAQRMHSEDVDYFLVVERYETRKLVGIVTDNDIALKVVGKGLSVVETQVQHIMTHNPIICYPLDDIEKTLERMESHQIRRFPVVDTNERVIGIIIQARVIQARIAIRLDSDHNISALTIKDEFDGWSDFAARIRSVVKRFTLINDLSASLTTEDDDLSLPAAAVG